ncbi:Caprin-1 [Geodia barretti]|uniref:Caprin-1 n=1 Tax=Geodia barretti TaxID=519541 RepID=A0AA35WT13_GEOBA|nr:Caprin-1 [Geodia barretti]
MPPKMPSKKKSGTRENSPTPTSTTPPGIGGVGWDLADPVATANGIVDKKARNLEKRKNKLITLKQSIETGAKLTPDQEDAVSKLGEVNIQLEMVKDLQKQFAAVTTEYQKLRKRQQKLEKQQQKDAEKDNMRKVLGYSFGVYHLLDSIDEVAKEHFAAGSNGAVQLTDSELGNLDSLYRLLAPSRAGNPSYRSDLLLASDHFLLLFEQSAKAVIGTNCIHFLTFPFLPLTLDISLTLTPYPPDKELYELLQKVEACEYFDKPHDDEEEDEEDDEEEEEEEEEEEVVEREPEVSRDDHVTAQPVAEVTPVDHVTYDGGYQGNQPRGGERDLASGGSGYIAQPYMPASVPSPTFPGLEGGGQQATGTDDGFSFMHDSEVTRPVPTATVQPTHVSSLPPSLPPSQSINSAHLHQPQPQYSYNRPPQSNTSPDIKGVKVIDGE